MSDLMFGLTGRGFNIVYFKDANGVLCTLQRSSIMCDEAHIWLGAKEIGLKHLAIGKENSWQDVSTASTDEDHYTANNRMHLTQAQVRELLPVLSHFAETGEISHPIVGVQFPPETKARAVFVSPFAIGGKVHVDSDTSQIEIVKAIRWSHETGAQYSLASTNGEEWWVNESRLLHAA